MSNPLNKQDSALVFRKGLAADINTTDTKLDAVTGEPHWTTDTDTLFVYNDTLNIPVVGHGPIQTVTASSDTLTPEDYAVLCDCTSNAITINLPAVSGNTGLIYIIKKIDSSVNAVTIDGNSSETIDGSTTAVINTQYESVTIMCNGSAWYIV